MISKDDKLLSSLQSLCARKEYCSADMYKKALKVIFYFVCPYGIMATIPTQAITRTLTPLGLGYAIGITALFTILALWFWRFGMRRYKSASS